MLRALMKILNQRNNQVIDQVHLRSGITGLMFRKPSRALLTFSREVLGSMASVWTPFMRFSLDLVFVNAKGVVNDIKYDLVPWKIYVPCGSSKYVIEVEAGLIRDMDFEIGDKLIFEN